MLERSKEGKSVTQRARSAEHRGRRGHTAVATGSMRGSSVGAQGIEAPRGADDGAWLRVWASERWVVSSDREPRRTAVDRRGRSVEICAETGATMGKGSAGLIWK
jgi:hypothetical protein